MPDSADISAFSPDYWAARDKFREAARAAGATLEDFANPAAPPPGHEGALTTDLAVLGHSDAGRVLLVNAGTHGVEAFAGSAIQIGFLAGQSRPARRCSDRPGATPSTRTASPGCAG